jgi:hypothetical protein
MVGFVFIWILSEQSVSVSWNPSASDLISDDRLEAHLRLDYTRVTKWVNGRADIEGTNNIIRVSTNTAGGITSGQFNFYKMMIIKRLRHNNGCVGQQSVDKWSTPKSNLKVCHQNRTLSERGSRQCSADAAGAAAEQTMGTEERNAQRLNMGTLVGHVTHLLYWQERRTPGRKPT